MVRTLLSLAVAIGIGTSTTGHFPTRGVVVPGVSFAGIRIGDSAQRVRAVWGPGYAVCRYCTDATWLYEYQYGEPIGAAARFQNGRVVALFSLGSPSGWRTNDGLSMGDPISNVYLHFPTTSTARCIGFDAVTFRIGKTVTAIYSSGGVIYGFAIVTPGMTICQ